MKNYIITVLSLMFFQPILAQELTSNHSVKQVGETNEYTIKTTISGLEGVELGKIEYQIPDKHSYKPSPKNTYFSDRKNNLLKFYLMAIPSNGIVEIEFNIIVNEAGSVVFPVQFQYSKNDEKNKISLSSIAIDNSSSSGLVVNEQPSQTKEEEKPKEVVVKEKEPEVILEKKEEKKPEPIATSTPKETQRIESTTPSSTTTKYAVQLFALTEYSQAKVNAYCKKHNLKTSEITTEKGNGLVKVRYGKVNSAIEAQQLKETLISKGVTGVFVVKLP
ncbi:MAG: hypothetical protein CVT95_03920 [Bacteroidetes bacterium HGW-Bacteroidetes-12]|jgi:hypothetical protein|nr:MAG: hypothetical protein CVT95_03920 [Bacteroidetes bacterium HGW-Bacteroidetes-12]